jgi:hypothetical protein
LVHDQVPTPVPATASVAILDPFPALVLVLALALFPFPIMVPFLRYRALAVHEKKEDITGDEHSLCESRESTLFFAGTALLQAQIWLRG